MLTAKMFAAIISAGSDIKILSRKFLSENFSVQSDSGSEFIINSFQRKMIESMSELDQATKDKLLWKNAVEFLGEENFKLQNTNKLVRVIK